jgi:RNAse (barnase) inhibitor barstar
MNDTQELKNKFKIFELVKNHFSLNKESLDLFKYRLFYERLIPKEFEDMKQYPDLRRRVRISEDKYEELDQGWDIFTNNFQSFVDTYEVKYSNFRKNKIKVNNQEMKFKKALEFYYLNNLQNAIKEFIGNKIHGNFFIKKSQKGNCLTIAKWYASTYCTDCKQNCRIEPTEYNAHLKNGEKIDYITTEIKNLIKTSILKILEQVGAKRIPNCGLEVVLSLNFADWFLCSTGEKWTSCISLDSTYDYAYWTGLPALIGDKNRGLVYLTDGSKKNYNGIVVDKIYSRTWIMLTRMTNGEHKNETFLQFIRDYPIDIGLKKISLKSFNSPLAKCKVMSAKISGEYRSRYYVEMFWHKVGKKEILNPIYCDNFQLSIAHKNKAKLFRAGTFGYYTDGQGSNCFIRKNNKVSLSDNKFFYEGGLNRLVNKKIWDTDKKKHLLKEVSSFYEGKENNSYYFDEKDGFKDGEED